MGESRLDLQLQKGPDGLLTLTVSGEEENGGRRHVHRRLDPRSHRDFLDLHDELSRRFDLRAPEAAAPVTGAPDPAVRAILTENLGAGILYGYGDPAVTRVRNAAGTVTWWLYVTSNDAPDAFPILRSDDLETWRPAGFVFPEGRAPAWAMSGPGADFWAPEMHQVGGAFWLCFTARTHDGDLAIGLARAPSPAGPFEPAAEPLLRGGVIDPHIVLDPTEAPHLVWKEDTNDRWPPLIARLMRLRPELGPVLFAGPRDVRTARLCADLLALRPDAAPMETFFILQPLIEAAADDFPAFRERLAALAAEPGPEPECQTLAREALTAARTVIRAQRMSDDGSALVGESTVILENDQAWEAHLIEGPWISRVGEHYLLLYAGNDFSTSRYGIGAALAAHPLGPYEKAPLPLLGSSTAWIAPGHPSVTTDAQGQPRMFMHGFVPGQVGYKAFRALLTAPLTVKNGQIRTGD
jgi:hypothetical protein